MKKLIIFTQIFLLLINCGLCILASYLLFYVNQPNNFVGPVEALILLTILLSFLIYLVKSISHNFPPAYWALTTLDFIPSFVYTITAALLPILTWYFKPFHNHQLIIQTICVTSLIAIFVFTYIYLMALIILLTQSDIIKKTHQIF